jgi:tetratricopeptide (TPR) repeat protein
VRRSYFVILTFFCLLIFSGAYADVFTGEWKQYVGASGRKIGNKRAEIGVKISKDGDIYNVKVQDPEGEGRIKMTQSGDKSTIETSGEDGAFGGGVSFEYREDDGILYSKKFGCFRRGKALITGADTYNSRGNDRLKNGDYAGALKEFTCAVKFDNDYADAYYNRAIAKIYLGNNTGAVKDLTRAIEIDPGCINAYNGRAAVKNNLGDYAGAVEDSNAAIKLDPRSNRAYYNRGVARDSLGDDKGAAYDLRAALRLGFKPAYELLKQIQPAPAALK